MSRSCLVLSVSLVLLASAAWPAVSRHQASVIAGARACVGDVYDSDYYAGGPPPKGRGACTDVLYAAFRKVGIDLQDEVDRDIRQNPGRYPTVRDRNIDYRWAPNLIVWFKRHAARATRWEPGDVVFWSLTGDGVADHCGIISDRPNGHGGPLVIHNFPPACREDDELSNWMIVGHFRL